MKKFLLIIMILFFAHSGVGHSAEIHNDLNKRLDLYQWAEAESGIPWYYIAGIDQYERSLLLADKDASPTQNNISIRFSDAVWGGIANPNSDDTNPVSIQFFQGIGLDGNGDGVASRSSDEDLLKTMTTILAKQGFDKEHFKIGLWEHYKKDRSVSIIMSNARLFEKYQNIDLQKKVFPISKKRNYTYKDTWAMARGFGGKRTHEGTDIFADYGTGVRSTCYGIVELKGWNRFGGWRIGIRDINNTYHYYAHLSSFAKDIQIGDLVEPGQIIGGVGSSGYGPVGTSGKFPPHLHYGMYKARQYTEWAFNPYPFLVKWERQSE